MSCGVQPSAKFDGDLWIGVDPATGKDYTATMVVVPPEANYTAEDVDYTIKDAIRRGLVKPPIYIYFHDPTRPGYLGVTP